MAKAVPAEGSDAVARLDVERSKEVRERVYAAVEIGVGMAVHAVRDFARDFLAGEELGGTLEEVGERERVVHHETLHSGLLLYDGGVLVFNGAGSARGRLQSFHRSVRDLKLLA